MYGTNTGTLITRLHAAGRSAAGMTFLASRRERRLLSYRELAARATALKDILQLQGLSAGEELVLQIRDDRDFLIAFWAALLGQYVPVPLAVGTNDEHRRKVLSVWSTLDSPFLLTDTPDVVDGMRRLAEHSGNANSTETFGAGAVRVATLAELYRDDDSNAEVEAFDLDELLDISAQISPESVALVQFSSGSTGDPKGVIVTHESAVANTNAMIRRLEIGGADRFLSWMPLTHDFGIIGMHLTPLCASIDQVQIPTSAFVRNPMIWMHAVDEFRSSITASPNFGYRHFLKGLGSRSAEAWDLSSLRIIQNGAEPISPSLCREFLSRLEPHGLDPHAMLPGYGLAEATLAVSYSLFDEDVPTITLDRNHLGPGDEIRTLNPGEEDAVEFVDVGFPVDDVEIRITGEKGGVTGENRIGAIEIRGRCVTSGYYNNAEATARAISADGWLNTGDLGFIRDGRLVITGRLKDIIFSGGVNYYPHDIERCAEEVDGIDVNRIAVSGLQRAGAGEEEVAAFVYFKRNLEDFLPIARNLRNHVLAAIGIRLDHIVPVTSIPKTTSGKVKRYALASRLVGGEFDKLIDDLDRMQREADVRDAMVNLPEITRLKVESQIRTIASEICGQPVSDPGRSLIEYGFDSVRAVELRDRIARCYQVELPVSLVFDAPDVSSLAGIVLAEITPASHQKVTAPSEDAGPASVTDHTDRRDARGVAIVGVGCRLAGGIDSLDELADLLARGGEVLGEVPVWRWGEDPAYAGARDRLPAGAFRDDVEYFDNSLFNISPAEAKWIDPQQRILLETVWGAIEDAGIDPESLRTSRTGVYVGISSSGYQNRWQKGVWKGGHYALTGNMSSTAAGRISYSLGLTGPTVSIDTACSSSLTALHLAVSALRHGEIDFALVGGVSLILDREGYEGLLAIGALSNDGRCHAFGAEAAGYGRGEGCGVVLLSRLDTAERTGSPILGILRGTAMSHDGRSNGLTAPSGPAQESVLRTALADAGLAPEDVDFIEAHGTGTSLGDPQEINAIRNVFSTPTRDRVLKVGSVKSNIGHLESAAGIAGLLKVLATFRRGVYFPSLHSRPLNPHLALEGEPIDVVSELEVWNEETDRPRVGGVSSFGMSGTNVHVLLSGPVSTSETGGPVDRTGGAVILPISAAHPDSLDGLVTKYRTILESGSESPVQLAAAAACGRAQLPFRHAGIGRSADEIVASLGIEPERDHAPARPRMGWFFSGQGSQYHGMGRALYTGRSDFRGIIDEVSRLFEPHLGYSLVEAVIRTDRGDSTGNDIDIDQTRHAQPAIFALGYSIGALLRSFGLQPECIGGHSVGEFAAAALAGVLSLEDAVALVAARGRLMQEVVGVGGMLSIFESVDEVIDRLNRYGLTDRLDVAGVNAPKSTVVAGPSDALEEFRSLLNDEGIGARPLRVSHAFHSRMMSSAGDQFFQVARNVTHHRPSIPFASSLRGRVLSSGDVVDAEYWRDQITSPVLFSSMVESAHAMGINLIVDCGANPVLAQLGPMQANAETTEWVPTLKRDGDHELDFLSAVGTLFTRGFDVEWRTIYPDGHDRSISLPSYPFRQRRYWIDAGEPAASGLQDDVSDEMQMNGEGLGSADRTYGNGSMRNGAHSNGSTTPSPVERREERGEEREGATSVTRLTSELRSILAKRTGYEPVDLPVDRDLFSLGMDSLVLMQVRQDIIEHYNCQLDAAALYGNVTIASLAERVADFLRDAGGSALEAGPEWRNGDAGPEREVRKEGDSGSEDRYDLNASTASEGPLADIVRAQLRLMSEQIQALREASGNRVYGVDSPEHHPAPKRPDTSRPVETGVQGDSFVPYRDVRQAAQNGSTGKTDRRAVDSYLEGLIERYCSMTSASKEATARYRPRFANNRNIAGFRPDWKELVYQIQVDRADGPYTFDIDGNRYVDLTMGFGVNLFGHNPSFIREALEKRLDGGLSVGPMSPMAGPVAEKLSRLTGVERVAFYNSGTEGVMVALRLARGATARERVVIFSGSYHGTFDGILALPGSSTGDESAIPLAPGVTRGMISDVVVLQYGTESALDYIRENADSLAAVLVEPVQSRRPDLQPAEFLQSLREITERSGTALIFDEVITGFRIGPGGAQRQFDVSADIVVYGKVIGGGMPIGIVAGKRRFLDYVDGGQWEFGDTSVPESRNTFVAGTFCHHPMAMAATMAVLEKLETDGTSLCARLNRVTGEFARSLNRYFESRGLQIRVVWFGSLFRLVLGGDAELLYFALLVRGVYVWEGRNCFFSTAHSDEDIDRVRRAIVEAVDDMIDAGVLVPSITSSLPVLPMSSVQRRMYTISTDPDAELAYHIHAVIRLDRRLDSDRAEGAIRRVAERHESLRTGFSVEDGDMVQRIYPESGITIETGEMAGESVEIERIATEFIRPFDLSRPPLLRILRVDDLEGRSYLIFDMHHIVGDGASLRQICAEFVREYNESDLTLESAPKASDPDEVVQYRDFVLWEQEYLRSDLYRAQRTFWEEVLAIPATTLQLPGDVAGEIGGGFRGGTVVRRLDVEPLRRLAVDNRATLYMVLLAIFSEFLRRVSGERSFRFGIVHAGRNRSKFFEAIGMFANSLIFPVKIDRGDTFSGLLQQVKGRLLSILDNADFPFEHLVELDSNVVADQRISLAFENLRLEGLDTLDGYSIGPLNVDNGTTIADLTLNSFVVGDLLELQLNYSSNLFTHDMAERFADLIVQLTNEILAGPEIDLDRHQSISPEERSSLLDIFTPGEDVDALPDAMTRFLEHVSQNPEKDALLVDGSSDGTGSCGRITYRELGDGSGRIASRILQEFGEGDGSGEIVAILLERTPAFVASIIGVLRSGAGFLLIDPALPDARIRFLIEDAGARVIVTSEDLESRLSRHGMSELAIGIVLVDMQGVPSRPEQPSGELHHLVDRPVADSSTAYLVYTSGSTGTPKGVVVTRRNLANYVSWITRERVEKYDLRVFSLHIAPSFDMIFSQIFPPLASGRAIWIHHPEMAIERVIRRSFSSETPVDQVSATPSHISLLEDEQDLRSNVRLVSLGGEEATGPVRDLLFAIGSETEVFNDYGPAEATISCTAHHLNSDGRVNVIGRPVPNCRVYILDGDLNLCPVGIPGEICIGGETVASGYLNQPELSSERFIEDPFRPGDRMYRTGDLGRILDDGTIEFLGRRDRQVKINGRRIEIGEVEAVLTGLDGVRKGVVDIVGEQGSERLVAWFVGDRFISSDDIRRRLLELLPEWTVPATITQVPEIPLTRNGKVDRSELSRRHPQDDPVNDASWNGELDPEEAIVAEVWSEILGTSDISPQLDFFRAGGDSIRAIRVASRLTTRGYRVDSADVLRSRTLERLAEILRSSLDSQTGQVALARRESGPFHLTPIQSWFFKRGLSNRDHWNQQVILGFPEELSTESIRRAIAELVSCHHALRSRFPEEGREGGRVSGLVRPRPATVEDAVSDNVAFVEAVVPTDRDEISSQKELRTWVSDRITESHRRIDISNGPLVSLLIIRSNSDEPIPQSAFDNKVGRTVVVLCIHHLVVDAVSWGILVEDFLRLVRDGANVEELTEETTTYIDFSERLAAELATPTLKLTAGYWRGVAERVAATDSPLPRTRQILSRAQSDILLTRWSLDTERTGLLLTHGAERIRSTHGELILGVLALALRTWTGNKTVPITLEWHGRKSFDGFGLDRTVGWFTSMFPFVVDAAGDVARVLAVQKDSFRSVPENGTGYSLLSQLEDHRAYLGPERLPEIVFNYLGTLDLVIPSATDESGVSVVLDGPGLPIAGETEMVEAVSIDAWLERGELRWSIATHRDEFSSEAIGLLVRSLEEASDAVIAWSLSSFATLTVSDITYRGIPDVDVLGAFLRENRVDPSDVETLRPLVPMQEGMYFEYLREPDDQSNRALLDISVEGTIDADVLREAWNGVIERYDALRTGFTITGAPDPVAMVFRSIEPDFLTIDVEAGDDVEERVSEIIDSEWDRGFDLSDRSACRVRLLRLPGNRSHLVIMTHHIIQDGWCIGLILGALLENYDHLVAGREIGGFDVPSYDEYICWLEDYDRSAGIEFWKSYLEGYRDPTSLTSVSGTGHSEKLPHNPPVGRMRPQQVLRFTTNEIDRMIASAARSGTTISVLLRTAWSLLLSALLGREDLVFGAVVSGRPPEIDRVDEIVGLFINTIPVRVKTGGGQSLSDLIRSVAENDITCSDWHHNSVADVLRAGGIKEKLFDHILVVENYPLDQSLKQGLSHREDFRFSSSRFRGDESFDLVIMAVLEISGEIRLTYNPHVYSGEFMEKIAQLFRASLARVCESVENPVKDIVGELALLASSLQLDLPSHSNEPNEVTGSETKKRRGGGLKGTEATRVSL